MHWASLAGIAEASVYAKAPGDASMGHYNRFLSSKLPTCEHEHLLYDVNVPAQSLDTATRGTHTLKTIPVHEALDDAWEPGTFTLLTEAIESNGLPPAYVDNPTVQTCAANEPVVPVALYVDGVPYSHVDGAIGFWLINMVTQLRVLSVMLRKKLLCKCGCRGW